MKNGFIIKASQKALLRQLILPLLLLAASLAVYLWVPKDNIFHPRPLNYKSRYENFYNRDLPHVTAKVPELFYSGFDYTVDGRTRGHYYYTLVDGFCQLYVLDREAGRQALLRDLCLRGRLIRLNEVEYESLLKGMAEELGWSSASIRKISAPYAVSTVPDSLYFNLIFLGFLYVCLFWSLFDLLCSLSYLLRPASAPAFRYLRRLGDVRTLLPKVEMEMKHVTVAKSGTVHVTPSYIIDTGKNRVLILPLSMAVWCYSSSRTGLFHGPGGPLSHTLHVVMRDGRIHDFKEKSRSDPDSLLQALKEQRPEILAGYSERNKAEAKRQLRQHRA